MFTKVQQDHILKVKRLIESHLKSSFVNTNYGKILDWKKVNLSGGAIASLLQGEKPKDWDFYFEDVKEMQSFIEFINSTKDEVADVSDKYADFLGQDGKMITMNAITMQMNNSFITLHADKIENIKKGFDFVHCTPHFNISQSKLYISEKQYDACVNKKLVVNNPKAVKTHRVIKFKERGYLGPI